MKGDILRRSTWLAVTGALALAAPAAAAPVPVASRHSHPQHHPASDQGAAKSGAAGGLIGNLLFPHPGPYTGGTYGNGPYGGYMGW